MEKKLDELLKRTLTPIEEPDVELNEKLSEKLGIAYGVRQKKEEKPLIKEAGAFKEAKIAGLKRTGLVPAALGAALLIGVGSATAIAAYRYLTPDEVAEGTGDTGLAEAFSNRNTVVVNETQVYGGYRATLLGVVSGENISDLVRISDNRVKQDRIYVVVAIEHEDGSPMPEVPEPGEPEEEEFFVSPLIRGLHPAFYNAASMCGNYTEIRRDGILYRLLECDNVEMFADRDLYLCVSDGSVFYNEKAYRYDKETGEISRNEEYQGLNALFRLPMDASAADPEKAKAYIQSMEIKAPEILWEKGSSQDINGHENGFEMETAEKSGKEDADENAEENIKEDVKENIKEDVQENAKENANENAGEGAKGAEAAEYALRFVGNPYAWSGESLTEGCDCSGFVKGVYEYFGISLPHSTVAQREYGEEVRGLENALPGDLIFYETPNHVGIYIGSGNIVHADPQDDICVSAADYDEIVMIRRIF